MKDEITNKVLLEHIQGMKYELQQQIEGLEKKIEKVEQQMKGGFDEAKQHRQALQEDLEATIAMQAKHQQKLEKISV
ncbi:MAG: hypothetical protein K9M03_02550 [Kiritimatiellales bacterium]|nr:hypothetical protein [Kiritimatiellales bacterium]